MISNFKSRVVYEKLPILCPFWYDDTILENKNLVIAVLRNCSIIRRGCKTQAQPIFAMSYRLND